MNLTPVTNLLRERHGLAEESLGQSTTVQAVVQARMQALGLNSAAAYAGRLRGDCQELDLLSADLIVPETWFFRGGDVFAYLAKHIAKAVGAGQGRKRFRVLSVPCSSGEEPFSLAIALFEAGVAPDAYAIDGVDLSPRQIERANQGMYSDLSLRQTTPDQKRRYFERTPAGWQLLPDIRSLVRFRQGNLLSPSFLAGEEGFDLIFCRNLFIYLHPDARRQALAALDRLLIADGLLCMGHAEPLELFDERFTRTGPDACFLYQKLRPAADQLTTTSLPAPARAAALSPPAEAPIDLMAVARRQADEGRLAEALATCRRRLAQAGASPALCALMGVLHQALGEKDEAASWFRRALYLEPANAEALMHWMLLCQEQGEHEQADRLRRRLDRARTGGEP
jgi:chemotaxis protein methyltransferase WspC